MTSPGGFPDFAARVASAARRNVENVVVLQRVDSTQALSRRLIDQLETEELTIPRTLVVGGSQINGIGRADRRWESPEGGLYLSWISSKLDASTIATLPVVAAVATWQAVTDLGVADARIKWPNDILVSGRKLAGILIHARHGETVWASIGLGVNLRRAPTIAAEPSTPVTAVAEHVSTGDPLDWVERLISGWLSELAAGLDNFEEHLTRWQASLQHRIGEEMVVRLADSSTLSGRYSGVTDLGHLRLEVAGVERVVSTGDVIE